MAKKTAPQFIISDSKNFEAEKKRLIDYIIKTRELGQDHFENLDSGSFGTLNKTEWNNLMYKHLDHHLNQFINFGNHTILLKVNPNSVPGCTALH